MLPARRAIAAYPNAPAGLTLRRDGYDPGCPVGGSDANSGTSLAVGFAYRLSADARRACAAESAISTRRSSERLQPVYKHRTLRPGILFNGVSFEDPYGSAGVTNPFPGAIRPDGPGPEATFVTPAELRAVFARGFPHAAADLLEPVTGAPGWLRLGVPRRLYRQQGHLFLWRRREQPRNQPGDLRARRLDGGQHPGSASVPGFQPHRTL